MLFELVDGEDEIHPLWVGVSLLELGDSLIHLKSVLLLPLMGKGVGPDVVVESIGSEAGPSFEENHRFTIPHFN